MNSIPIFMAYSNARQQYNFNLFIVNTTISKISNNANKLSKYVGTGNFKMKVVVNII